MTAMGMTLVQVSRRGTTCHIAVNLTTHVDAARRAQKLWLTADDRQHVTLVMSSAVAVLATGSS